ncbi:MAG: YbgC/FadM family acyl-CoA thioesterase [Pseudomonadota bacterium]|nr:YbgC/FadM family acyl-CoA thioesterase [Pseudomonadota bacterium]
MNSDISGSLKGTTHYFKIRVYYEDTDFTGIVYHANYLKFAERGRTNFLRLLGINHSDLINDENPKYFVVYSMETKFLGTATIDDILEVRSYFKGITGPRLRIDQEIFNKERNLFFAKIEFAILDIDGKPRKFPDDMISKIEPYVN